MTGTNSVRPMSAGRLPGMWKFAMAMLVALGISTSLNVRQAEAKHVGAFVAGAIIGGVIAHHVVRHHHKKRYRVVRVKRHYHHYRHVRPVVTIRFHKHRHYRKHHRYWVRY
ncbi:MAG: hypothetical protein KDJ48_03175 [Nitratireductor sp.]|nr:hypothetical protein [Nitratireductor sp.]MCB1458266.1 hypothetical protein [Nitratireductor sp.]